MKKAVISILLLLPFVLLVIIAIAGRIYGNISYIKVESVELLTHLEQPIVEKTIQIEKNTPYQLKWKILPENATDKGVKFTSSIPEAVTVSEDGIVTGLVADNSAIITITTNDGAKTDSIMFEVTDSHITGIELSAQELSLRINQTQTIVATVLPITATEKGVVWYSSNPEVVSVDNGVVKALKEGEATIYAVTMVGSHTASCQVIVKGEQKVYFKESKFKIDTASIDLKTLIAYDEDVDISFITFELVSGPFAVINNHILTFSRAASARIKVFYADSTAFSEAIILYQ